jgi:hypothetical protein
MFFYCVLELLRSCSLSTCASRPDQLLAQRKHQRLMLISSADLAASRQPEVFAVSACLVFVPSPRIYLHILLQNNIISEEI